MPIGSEVVLTVGESPKTVRKTGRTAIKEISRVYGNQATAIPIDPRRVYADSPGRVRQQVIQPTTPGPNGERHCRYPCTVKVGGEMAGRFRRDQPRRITPLR